MVVEDIIDQLNNRRSALVDLLEESGQLGLEKQHQIYGAINEIDLFIQILTDHQEEDIGPITLVRPNETEDFFSKFFQNLKDKVKRNK